MNINNKMDLIQKDKLLDGSLLSSQAIIQHPNPNSKFQNLIKLKKRSISAKLYKKKKNTKIIAKSQGNDNKATCSNSSTNQTEYNLRNFWRYINQYYFKNIEENDLQAIYNLLKLITSEIQDTTIKYSSPQAYWSFKNLISNDCKNKYQDENLNKITLRNLQKHYMIETLTNPLIIDQGNDEPRSIDTRSTNSIKDKFIKNLQKVAIRRHSIDIIRPEKKNIKGLLLEESNRLDEIMDKINDIKKDDRIDDISYELERLILEQKSINNGNIKKLNDLQKRAKLELINGNPYEIISFLKPDKTLILKDKNNNCNDSLNLTKKNSSICELNQKQLTYLSKIILSLEKQQAAESIKFVAEAKKSDNDYGEFIFLTIFDPALTTKEVWLEENILEELNKLRENSLFKIYPLPQKCVKSLSSQNIAGLTTCLNKFNNKFTFVKEKPCIELMKKKSFSDESYYKIIQDYNICHHCKNLYSNEYLVKCNYRSSLMGMFVSNNIHANSNGSNTAKGGGLRAPNRTVLISKRSIHASYIKKNSELICQRRFCRICLKQNYDLNLEEISTKADWICPFCKGICFCSRCLRNDHLNKLINMFITLGGDINQLKKDSYLEQYIFTHHGYGTKGPRAISRYALKPTSKLKEKVILKKKIKKFKNSLKEMAKLKKLRVHMEKLRIFCAQINKREKIKCSLQLLNEQLFDFENGLTTYKKQYQSSMQSKLITQYTPINYVYSTGNKLLQKRKRGRPSKVNNPFEPPVLKKVLKTDTKVKIIPVNNDNNTNNIPNIINLIKVNKKKRGRKSRKDFRNSVVQEKNCYMITDIQSSSIIQDIPAQNLEQTLYNKSKLTKVEVDNSKNKKYIYRSNVSRSSNPNEPADIYEDKPIKLKRELQKLIQNQSKDNLVTKMNGSLWETHQGPLTRTSAKALLKNNSKNDQIILTNQPQNQFMEITKLILNLNQKISSSQSIIQTLFTNF